MASGFPNLPGYVPTQDLDKTNWKRVSAKKQELNRDSKNEQIIVYPLPRKQELKAPDQKSALHPDYISTTHSTFKPTFTGELTELFQPTYVKLDKQVLRFYGFFKEAVSESNLENYRVRKLEVLFYLEDNSIMITEPKQTNSGIPQGPFLKRQKVLRKDKKFYTIKDIRVGSDIDIYGKSIFICNCDVYTREFYENLGEPQSSAVDMPSDNFEQKTLTKFVPKKDAMMKDFMEHKLGGGRVPSQKQFLENDRKVLKFYCESGIPYIIHYYLADDTMEVREVKTPNCGRDPFPLLVKRQKLPKKLIMSQPGHTSEAIYYKPDEIKCGEDIELYGRKFFITGCDPFTHEFYAEKYGIDFPIGSINQKQNLIERNFIIPPHNGFGDEQDSLGYVYRLIPKPPKKDYFKWMDNQNYLRFKAVLNTTKPEDVDREFIITFHLFDDTVLVYEPNQRNSGFGGGKFLEKGKYKNSERENKYFDPSDFIVGQDVKINGFSFKILEADEITKKWYAQYFKEDC